MLIYVYSIFDSKARVYSRPFYAANAEVAARMFAQVCNDRTTDFYKHPHDFSLWAIGSFDDNDGLLLPFGTIQNLGLAAQFREVANASQS